MKKLTDKFPVLPQLQVSKGYVYCFNDPCEDHANCLRWMASQQIDTEH